MMLPSPVKTVLLFFVLGCAVCFGEESTVSISRDKRFHITLGNGPAARFAIRDAAGAILATDEDFSFGGAFSFADTEVLWSGDSQMAIVRIPRMYRHSDQGSAHAVLRWDGKRFVEIALPEDAIPLRWAEGNRLVCSVRADATLQITPDGQAFAAKPAKAK